MIADKNYFLDEDGNVTTDAAQAARLLVYKGQPLDERTAAKYGFNTKVSRKTEADEKDESDAKGTAPTENKAVKSPAKNTK
jgi:hypothetical protein